MALTNLAHMLATRPDRLADADALFYHAVDAGETPAMSRLATLLSTQPGRDAEALCERALAAGHPDVLNNLAVLIGRLPGREAEAERILAQGYRRR